METLRGDSVEFGIIPFPKYEESQKDYYSRIASLLLCFVPSSVNDLELTGACLEALCSESKRTLIPVYYDIMLGSKLTRDAESVEMLDIIFEHRVCDHGDLTWCPDLRDGIFSLMMENNSRDMESRVQSKASKINSNISKIVDSYLESKE